MKRKHEMPFGEECRDNNSVRVRLWAPQATEVEIELHKRSYDMSRLNAGWFELVTAAHAGDQYCFKINGRHLVPDPASRFQPSGVHGPSEVVTPVEFSWDNSNRRGRPWHEAVIYE